MYSKRYYFLDFLLQYYITCSLIVLVHFFEIPSSLFFFWSFTWMVETSIIVTCRRSPIKISSNHKVSNGYLLFLSVTRKWTKKSKFDFYRKWPLLWNGKHFLCSSNNNDDCELWIWCQLLFIVWQTFEKDRQEHFSRKKFCHLRIQSPSLGPSKREKGNYCTWIVS